MFCCLFVFKYEYIIDKSFWKYLTNKRKRKKKYNYTSESLQIVKMKNNDSKKKKIMIKQIPNYTSFMMSNISDLNRSHICAINNNLDKFAGY